MFSGVFMEIIFDNRPLSTKLSNFDSLKKYVLYGILFLSIHVLWSFSYPIDIEFVKTFLLTYQSFATPDKLLRKLVERYNVVRTEGIPLSKFSQVRQTIQARVINALRLWVEYGVDFKGKLSVTMYMYMYLHCTYSGHM